MADALTAERLAQLRSLAEKAFKGPWTYTCFEIECGYDGCEVPACQANPEEHEGLPHDVVEIAAPDEYPDGQVVAQINVPGLEQFADANGKYIAACDPQTVLALLDEVERLRETVRLYKLRSECLHCGALLEQSEADKEHWRTCDEHPARAERDALQKRLDSAEVYNNALEEERKRIGLQLHEAKQEWAERCKRQEAGLRAAEAERDDLRKQLDEASDVLITSGIEIGTLQIRAEKAEAALRLRDAIDESLNDLADMEAK